MSDFLIIVPSASRSHSNVVPFGPLFLAESLLRNGLAVEILDGIPEDILNAIPQKVGPETIAFGISTFSGTQLKSSIMIAQKLKHDYPNIPIVWGGVHVTALPQQTLEAAFVDYIAYGEGEVSLPLLLKAIKIRGDVSSIKGIGFKRNGKNLITENIGYTDLERTFDLPYHLLDMKKYSRELIVGPKNNYYAMASRGCPFGCTFCSNSSHIWPNMKIRYHSIDHIIGDIKTLVTKYNADGISFADENYFVKESMVVEICQALIKNKLNAKIKFRTSARADTLSRLPRSVWELLREAGFIAIGVGIESGSQRILDFIGKGITLEQVYRTDELLNKYQFYKSYNFMTCIPGETIDDIKQTLQIIANLARTSKHCPFPFSTLHKYIPLPGTELYRIAIEQYGFVPPDTTEGWVHFDFENVLETIEKVRPWLSRGLLSCVDEANRLIEHLNSLYVGAASDSAQIDRRINDVEKFITAS